MLRPPEPDPTLDPFRGGVAVLRRDGEMAGCVATQVTAFWAPLGFSLRCEWLVWYIVRWSNGDGERADEDYPPWSVVAEMQSGIFVWEADDPHRGQYTDEWLPEEERAGALKDLGTTLEDF